MNQEQLFREAIRETDRMILGICCHYFGPGDEARDAYQEILLHYCPAPGNAKGTVYIALPDFAGMSVDYPARGSDFIKSDEHLPFLIPNP